jgi:tetratricopeptide (TPR) repeat protein
LKGKAYLKEANVYAQLGQYDEAISYCDKAAEADITVSGPATRLKDSIKKAQANQAANARAKAAYDEYMAKRKAEEDFWTKGL